MIETLVNLNNNKLKRNVTQIQGGEAVERMKKFLASLSKRRHGKWFLHPLLNQRSQEYPKYQLMMSFEFPLMTYAQQRVKENGGLWVLLGAATLW